MPRILFFVILILVEGFAKRPECRKAGVAVVVPLSPSSSRSQNHELVVWAGKGNHRDLIFRSLYSFEFRDREWRGPLVQRGDREDAEFEQKPVWLKGEQAAWLGSGSSDDVSKERWLGGSGGLQKGAYVPSSRWKTFADYSDSLKGVLVWGGSTRPHAYFNDLWLLRPSNPNHGFASGGSWRLAEAAGCSAKYKEVPVARRAFGAALLRGYDDKDDDSLAIGFGRDGKGRLLEDLWIGHVRWPKVRWCKVWDAAEVNAEEPAEPLLLRQKPPHRRGHVMVYLPRSKDPVLVIMGGRTYNTEGYYSDIWAFHLDSKKWEEWTPEKGSPSPQARDHFSSVAVGKWIYIFGGRGGKCYNSSVPLSDVWRFDTEALRWEEVRIAGGRRPLPRFLAMASSYALEKGAATPDRIVVMGGETPGPPRAESTAAESLEGREGSFDGCYLNDVWEFSIAESKWRELSPPRWCTHRCKQLDTPPEFHIFFGVILLFLSVGFAYAAVKAMQFIPV